MPSIDDTDRRFLQGLDCDLAERSGATVQPGGTTFRTWAPNALAVAVALGDEQAPGATIPMAREPGTGLWAVTGIDAPAGTPYRFALTGPDGVTRLKADPLARRAARRPSACSIVHVSEYTWADADWLARRAGRDHRRSPLSIYELHLGTWRWHPDEPGRERPYTELAGPLADHAERLGFTHVELMPIAMHPFPGSWGYQGTGYYAPDPRHGDPDGLKALIDHLHGRGIGVILDWVPGHFSADDWALARFDGTPTYEHPDPRRGTQPQWGSLVFDYSRPEVRSYLLSCARYWLAEYHADGLRIDAVSSMLRHDWGRPAGEVLPNEDGSLEHHDAIAFLRELNAMVAREAPGAFTIAEEATAWPGVTAADGLGFTFCWDMGWSNDWMRHLGRPPAERAAHHNDLTFASVYADAEAFVLALSHDVVAERSLLQQVWGDEAQRRATVRALLALQWAHRGKQLLFMGCELGMAEPWTHHLALDWTLPERDPHSAATLALVAALGAAYRDRPALWSRDDESAGMRWLQAYDRDHGVYVFERCGAAGERLVCAANLGSEPQAGYDVPGAGPGEAWRIVLNTDAAAFGGAGGGAAHASPTGVALDLPPLSCLWLEPEAAGA